MKAWPLCIAAALLLWLAGAGFSAEKPKMVDVTIDGETVRMPEGMAMEYVRNRTSATGKGSDFAGDPEAAKSFSSQAPDLTQDQDGSMEAKGGTTTFAGRKVSTGSVYLYVFGALCLIAGIAVWILTQRRDWGLIGIASGLSLIGCGIIADSYPWVPVVVIFAVIGGGGGWLVYKVWTNGVPKADADKLKADAERLKSEAASIKDRVAGEFQSMIDDAKRHAAESTDPAKIAEWTIYAGELQERMTRIAGGR